MGDNALFRGLFCAAALLVAAPLQAFAATGGDGAGDAAASRDPDRPLTLTAPQMFGFADTARDNGDYRTAEHVYRALTRDPDLETRTEARFRLARLYADRMDRPREAAVLLRRILDDKPDVAAVRIELARVQAMMGDFGAARRELRAVQAGELPPQVERLVRFYSGALSARKMTGINLEVAFAPSTNINRATSDTTLDTVIGDFVLGDNARARSGVGLSLKGQAYARLPVSQRTRILARVSADGDLYRRQDFSDLSLAAQVGPQVSLGESRLSLSASLSHRWYGFDPTTLAYGLTGNWQRPVGRTTQLRMDATALREESRRNPLQTGGRYSLAASLDHAFTRTLGGGVTLFANRFAARDPGYATLTGGGQAFVFREFGRTSAVFNLGYSHLEADERLFIYPRRRRDDRLSTSLSGTFRALTIGTFAPLVRLSYERNFSTINIYDFSRLAAEFGVTAAF